MNTTRLIAAVAATCLVNADESPSPEVAEAKTPKRPGSKWATGRRRELSKAPREPKGFFRGARVRW